MLKLMEKVDSTKQFLNSETYLRRIGKIASVQLQKLVDSMPDQIFANGGSTKY